MKSNKDAVEILVRENIKLMKKGIDSAKVNRTVYGRILESLGDNKYKIMVNGGEYTVRSHWTHKKNDVVTVIVCNNDWGKLYVLY